MVAAGEVLLRVPKKLCIYSNVNEMNDEQQSIGDNAKALINTLQPSQWRLRLAIAILRYSQSITTVPTV